MNGTKFYKKGTVFLFCVSDKFIEFLKVQFVLKEKDYNLASCETNYQNTVSYYPVDLFDMCKWVNNLLPQHCVQIKICSNVCEQ